MPRDTKVKGEPCAVLAPPCAAFLRGYDLALAQSLEAAERLIEELGEQYGTAFEIVVDDLRAGLAVDRLRLGAEARVVRGNGSGF